MAVFTCKMCGGSLNVDADKTVTVCEYCGTTQTIPRLDSDKKAALYDRANHFRRNNDYDKAATLYEQILNEDITDAEAYWSLVLCRYGVEYVSDPTSGKRIPTINRVQFTSIFDDSNYTSALKYADVVQRNLYQAEAATINEIQKRYLEISQTEAPFDIFLCYKESDSNGKRTPDSVLAQQLYYELNEVGYKVFFARITLEDKLGSAYEPYIFSALNTAKVMVVIGTKPEYFSAPWVKNEWSRYLALIRNGEKKMLIPAYRDMDPYDMPEEFSHLQAQNMANLGFMQDLLRGIQKIVKKETAQTETPAEPAGNATLVPLLKRAQIFLEEGDFDDANNYCEKALDIDPENGKAYLYKLLAELRMRRESELSSYSQSLNTLPAFRIALRFADNSTAIRLQEYEKAIQARLDAKFAEQQRAAAEAERRKRAENISLQDFAEFFGQQTATDMQQLQQHNAAQREKWRKKRNGQIGWGIFFLFFFWPVGVYLLIRAASSNREMNKY